jgi:hypothetical protein
MKTSIITSIFASVLFVLGSCSNGPTANKATGVFFDIVVVADPMIWNNTAGILINDELTSDVPGLPQDETFMRVTYVPSSEFKGMLTFVRNILMVSVDETLYTKVSVKTEQNRWAKGQAIVYVTTPTASLLVDYLKDNEGVFINYFFKTEMTRMADELQRSYNRTAMEKLNAKFNVQMNITTEIKFFNTDTTDFFWTSNNTNAGRMDMVVYTFPYTDPQTFTHEYMLAMRDSVLGANIPGGYPNSYMSTNALYTTYMPITLYGKYCGVLRGLWEMKGAMMGGPFVSFARLDEANNRVVVAEGFVFAPETDRKKTLMRRLEASLHTLRLPGEFGPSLDGAEIID